MAKKKQEPAQPAPEELLERFPSIVPARVGAALSHVRTILADPDPDMRATSLILLVGMVADAGDRERANLSFYAGVYALLHLRDGRGMFGKISALLGGPSKGRKRPPMGRSKS